MNIVLVTPLDVEGLRFPRFRDGWTATRRANWMDPQTLAFLAGIAEEGRLGVDADGRLYEARAGVWRFLALVNETLAKLHEEVTA